MKIPRAAMTPALDAALRAFIGDGFWYQRRHVGEGPPPVDPARRLLVTGENRKLGEALPWFFGLVGLVFGAIFWFFENDDRVRNARYLAEKTPEYVKPVGNFSTSVFLASAGLIAVGLLVGFWRRSIQPAGPTPQAEFLAAALDRLDLAPVQRRYAGALAAVYSGRANDPGGEGLALLRSLADEEERLTALVPTVARARAPEIGAEADEIRARLATTRDPAAREALGQSLALAERRMGAAIHADAVRERLDAHRSLLDQAAAAATETIFGRGDSAPGLDTLRRNVASLGREVTALEAAVQEMRAL